MVVVVDVVQIEAFCKEGGASGSKDNSNRTSIQHLEPNWFSVTLAAG